MIFTAYYTEGIYEKVAEAQLIPTLKWWNLNYDVVKIPDLGSWQKNTGYKSLHILNMLEKHKQDICCIDVDAEIVRYPELFFRIPDEYDLAYHNLDWNGHWKGNWKMKNKWELLSGTIFFRYRPKIIELIKHWREKVLEEINTAEQLVLQRIITKPNNYKAYILPVEYCTIVRHNNTIPDYIKDPVIIHTQASRRFKNRKK